MAARRNHWGVVKVFADMTSQRLFDGHQACQRRSQPVGWVGYVVGIILCDGTRVPGVHPISLASRKSWDRCLVSIGVVVSVVPTGETSQELREASGYFFVKSQGMSGKGRHWVRFWGGATCRESA